MKLRFEPNEIDRATKHLSPQELGCWFRMAVHYTDSDGQVRADDGELKSIMQCPDTAFARVKGQVLSGREWMFSDNKKGKIANAKIDEMLKVAWQQTQAALQAKSQPK